MKSTLAVLESVMAARDPYTVAHQQRVTQLSLAIAEEIGLQEECIGYLETAARLHDLGKISVPIDILSKPGKLSVQEMELIKAILLPSMAMIDSIHSIHLIHLMLS